MCSIPAPWPPPSRAPFSPYEHCLSLEYTKPKLDYPRAAAIARSVIEQVMAHQPGPGSLTNINIPSLDKGPIRGIRAVPQNTAPHIEKFDRRVDPRGRTYFWTSPATPVPTPTNSDVSALADGFITVTPFQFNLTAWKTLEEMQGWQWKVPDA